MHLRRPRAGNDEENLSAAQPASEADAWISRPDEDQGRAESAEPSPPEGKEAVGGLAAAGMDAARRFAFRRARRIRRRSDFEEVFRVGRRLDAKTFVISYRANGLGYDRLGLSVSRRLGGAVRRNRAKRILRELFRSCAAAAGREPGLDIVVVPRPALLEDGYRETERRWRDAVESIKSRLR